MNAQDIYLKIINLFSNALNICVKIWGVIPNKKSIKYCKTYLYKNIKKKYLNTILPNWRISYRKKKLKPQEDL